MHSLFPANSAPSGALLFAVSHVVLFDALLAALAGVLTVAYHLIPSYGAALLALTLAVSVITLPLSWKSMKTQAVMAKIQPRLAELRRRYKENPERLTAETRALFKEHRISPLAGCLASVLQLPVFMTMFQVIRGLAHRQAGSATFRPRYLDHGSRLYKPLSAGHTMRSWGVDLAQTGIAALHTTPLSAIIVCLLVTITVVAGVVQQRIAAKPTRRVLGPRATAPTTAGRAASIAAALFGLCALWLPVAVGVYYAAATLLRLGQQWAFTRIHPFT
jgi:YidC/Oxa1 family membrane protein insertase